MTTPLQRARNALEAAEWFTDPGAANPVEATHGARVAAVAEAITTGSVDNVDDALRNATPHPESPPPLLGIVRRRLAESVTPPTES